MTTQLSFNKDENELLPDYRNKIGKAESTEDVKKIFAQTMGALLTRVFNGNLQVEYDDISLAPQTEARPFTLSDRLGGRSEFAELWEKSDLPHVIGRLAQTAQNRYRHLEKHPEKTNSKIRM
ncbi:hypothetical protein ACHHRT_00810 [Desulfurivibrio sp. D14AmB]|uniref:hypothetical protein n=1 Tax=Desulfurivibrio sp. D14AmB TaxID=3374370 RepID=UPI00376F2B62